jgi:glycosyltransferase involved in cell wall biosynthesis
LNPFAFVHPTLYEEFGFQIIEAQTRELPVVIYERAMIPDEVRRHCNVAKNESHMAGILLDLKKNGYDKKLKLKATNYARQFTLDRTVKGTYEAYKKMF